VKDDRLSYDDDAEVGYFEDGGLVERGAALDGRAVDSVYATNERSAKKQQQQQASARQSFNYVQDNRRFSDSVIRNSASSNSGSGSSRPASVDPVSYHLPPRLHPVAVSDADTQTPHTWADSGSGSRAGPVTSRVQQQQQTMSAAELQKYTGRAVPGVVVNEHHNLWTVVQVMETVVVVVVATAAFFLVV
jgi:hypothetical protein